MSQDPFYQAQERLDRLRMTNALGRDPSPVLLLMILEQLAILNENIANQVVDPIPDDEPDMFATLNGPRTTP